MTDYMSNSEIVYLVNNQRFDRRSFTASKQINESVTHFETFDAR